MPQLNTATTKAAATTCQPKKIAVRRAMFSPGPATLPPAITAATGGESGRDRGFSRFARKRTDAARPDCGGVTPMVKASRRTGRKPGGGPAHAHLQEQDRESP